MRPLWKDILAAVWLGILLPGIVLQAFVLQERHRQKPTHTVAQIQMAEDSGHRITLRDPDGTQVTMDLDTYLTGVLLAEIPAEFHEEALKAQATAARTYAWKACTTGGKHTDGSICGDSTCCQAYLPEASYLDKGGMEENLEKVRKAVQTTKDMMLVYDGALIEATYFSSSGGRTEAAVEVWGTDFPYLQSVSSPETVPEKTVLFTVSEFQDFLGKKLSGDPGEWFGQVTYTQGNGVDFLEICGERYTGLELRSLLGLRSTDFWIAAGEEGITVGTNGYGHRVGMSQYGANTMAEAGFSWQEILQHYYPGTQLVPISDTALTGGA